MQDQLLDQALEFHRKGQLKEALTIYQDLLKDKKPKLHVFLNASAILRSARNILKQYLVYNAAHIYIHKNPALGTILEIAILT